MAYLALISGIVKGAGQIVQGVTSVKTAQVTAAGNEQVAQTNLQIAQDQEQTAALSLKGTESGTGGSNTTLYVIGGIVLAGIVIAVVMMNKNKQPVIVQQS